MHEPINPYIESNNSVQQTDLKPTRAKKALVVIAIILASILLLLGGSALLLQHHKVQTYVVGLVAKKLSKTLHADVAIQHIHYRPLNHLTLDSLYISDQLCDTLLFVEKANIEINLLQLANDRLDLTLVELTHPYVNIQSISDSTLNCTFLLDMLQRPDSAVFPLRVNVDQLQLVDTRIRYNQYLVQPLNLTLELPVLSADSLDLNIEHLYLQAHIDEIDAYFQSTIHGGLDSIFADEILLVYHGQRLFSGNVAIYHPTQLDQLYTNAQCTDLYCNYAILQDILSLCQTNTISLPKPLANLEHMHYRGNIKGRFEHMDLNGTISTGLGTVNVNGYLKADTTLQNFDFCGDLVTTQFQLGKMIDNPDLGALTIQAHIDSHIDSLQLTQCVGDVNIQEIDYKGYTYHDVHFNGQSSKEEMSGTLIIKDENINLKINGLADWSKEDTRLNITARVQNLAPAAIHLIEQYPELTLNGMVYISLFTSGNKKQMLDNLTGYVIIDTLEMYNGNKQATMQKFEMHVDTEWENKQQFHNLIIKSDFLTSSISGRFQYATLPNTFQQMFHQYLPSTITKPKKKNKYPNDLSFYAYFRDLQKLCDVFDLDLGIPLIPTIKGYVNEQNNQIGVQAYIPSINTQGTQLKDITLALDNQNDHLSLSAYVFNRLPKDNPTAARIGDVKAKLRLTAKQDKINATIQLDNTDSVQNAGTIHLSTHMMQYANQPLASIHIQPTTIILNDSIWTINEADLIYNTAEQRLDIYDFSLNTDYQAITASGSASKSNHDSVKVELRNIDIQYLLSYTPASEAISVQGPLTGWATLYNLFSQPMVEAQAFIPNAGLNNTYLGDVSANAYLDYNTNSIIIEGTAIDSTQHLAAKVEGKVIPSRKWWGLDIQCDSVDVGIIDFWTHSFFANPKGRAFGNLHVFGENHTTWVTADMFGKDIQVTVPQIGATFQFSDSIHMDSTSIQIPQLEIKDIEGNSGTFEGIITHTNFRNFQYNLNARVNNMLVLNLPEDHQALFYGKVYGTGNLNITGDDNTCKISVNATTENYSKFFLSVNTASTANTSSFVQFVAADTTNNLLHLLNQPSQQIQPLSQTARLILSLQVEVTPTTEIQIRMSGDDGIKGRGEGNIQINYDDSSEDLQMFGSYTLQSGLFAFTLGNLVHRNFDIAEGSRVTWSGDPLSPIVDITGRYHTTASLRDLFGNEFDQVATNRSSIPVNCVLYMTDQLFNPTLKFAVELPQSDESVQSQINSIINTEEMLMRQVIYLLVFNRFYTPDYLQNSQTIGLNETYSLLSSTITGQINAWLSKLTDIFTMGFNFRTDGEGETASQEYEANFQLRPINQLIINGNFGYRYNDLSNRPFFGDLDIEYLLTPNGKLRAKAYTHTVDKYSLRQANTVQGVGLIFKHDFNWPFKKSKKDAPKVQSIDNTIINTNQ